MDVNRNKYRKTNFELLRIIAMLMIVGSHFSCHSHFSFVTRLITMNRLWIQFLTIGGKLGVDIFILISGYFLIDMQNLRIEKVIRLWLQIFFYSCVIYFFCVACGIETFSIFTALKVFFPIMTSQWWFATTYFIMFLFAPFINRLLKNLDERSFQMLILLSFFIWCIVPTVFRCVPEMSNLAWFISLYSVSAYIRLWKNQSYVKPCKAGLLALISLICSFGMTVMLDILGTIWPVFAGYATSFQEQHQLPTVAIALSLFLLFKNIKIPNSKIINTLSMTTFGIYLLHENQYIRPILWGNVQGIKYSESPYLFLYSLLIIFSVFLICALIEYIRIYTVEKFYMNLICKKEKDIENAWKKIMDSFRRVIFFIK